MYIDPVSSTAATASAAIAATAAIDFVESINRNHAEAVPIKPFGLTGGDLDVIRSMFGPELAHNAARIAAGATGLPSNHFITILIANRASGLLPAGVQISAAYLQAMYDKYANYSGPGEISNPLTEQNLADALEFLRQRRSEGGQIDIPA